MVWILIPVGLVIIVLMYLLLAPFFVEVDSDIGLYRMRMHRIASAAVRLTESSLIIDLNVLGWKKVIDLLGSQEKTESKEEKDEVKAKPIRKHRRVSLRKVLAVIRSFKINTCRVIMDTGDMSLNGMLYPVFYWLSVRSGKAFRVSFNDENTVKLQIENNIARLLWAYWRTL